MKFTEIHEKLVKNECVAIKLPWWKDKCVKLWQKYIDVLDIYELGEAVRSAYMAEMYGEDWEELHGETLIPYENFPDSTKILNERQALAVIERLDLMTEPFLYIDTGEYRYPYTPSSIELMSDLWEIVEQK